MIDSDMTLLPGLPGDNPLGFLAALGAQAALVEQGHECALSWTDQPVPSAVVTPSLSLDEIADAALALAAKWLEGPALDEEIDPKLKLKSLEDSAQTDTDDHDEVIDPILKLKPPTIREYLCRGRAAGTSGVLASCLLAEDSLDNSKNAKPTDLYFTAGQQKFVSIARSNLENVTVDELVADLESPWSYGGDRDSLMWDTVDDRDHALSASDPSKTKKSMNPGAEALAVIGLSRFPCFASPGRTLTRGCSGGWKRGEFVWPLWSAPASVRTVDSLLAQVAPEGKESKRQRWYRAWGIDRILQSQIRRSDQGGYGTFGPPRVVWQRE